MKSENYLYRLKFNLAICKIYCLRKFIIKYARLSEYAAVSQFFFLPRMTVYNTHLWILLLLFQMMSITSLEFFAKIPMNRNFDLYFYLLRHDLVSVMWWNIFYWLITLSLFINQWNVFPRSSYVANMTGNVLQDLLTSSKLFSFGDLSHLKNLSGRNASCWNETRSGMRSIFVVRVVALSS